MVLLPWMGRSLFLTLADARGRVDQREVERTYEIRAESFCLSTGSVEAQSTRKTTKEARQQAIEDTIAHLRHPRNRRDQAWIVVQRFRPVSPSRLVTALQAPP